MFELYTDKVSLPCDRMKVLRFMKSFTSALVAPPQRSVQQCNAYICTYDDEGVSVYIYLYLNTDKIGILYRYSDPLSSPEDRQAAEEDANQFAEDMGFLMDDLKFDKLDASKQESFLSSIPLFSQKGSAVQPETVHPIEEEAIKVAESVIEKAVIEVRPPETFKAMAEEINKAPLTVTENIVAEKKSREEMPEKPFKSEPKTKEKTWIPEILSKFRIRASGDRGKKG